VFRIQIRSGFNQASGSVSRREKIEKYEISCFEVLNVLFEGLEASSVAWTSIMEAYGIR
jgi:hypothetical protein